MRERISAIVAIVLLLLLIGASYFYATQSGLKDLKYIPGENSPDYTAENITVTTFGPDGNPQRRLIGRRMLHYSDDRTDVTEPELVAFEPSKPKVIAKARRGWTNDGGQTIEFEGQVSLDRAAWKNSAAMSFRTTKLTAYPDTERFVSSVPVAFAWGEDRTTAGSMVYDNARGTISLSGNVKTHIVRQKK